MPEMKFEKGQIVKFVGKKRKWKFVSYNARVNLGQWQGKEERLDYYCTLCDPECERVMKTYALQGELEAV